jgi:hypothetical protein
MENRLKKGLLKIEMEHPTDFRDKNIRAKDYISVINQPVKKLTFNVAWGKENELSYEAGKKIRELIVSFDSDEQVLNLLEDID